MRRRCFKCFNGGLPDAVPVASAFPDRLNRKYAGSDPAYDSCIIHSQQSRDLSRGKIFLFHTGINVPTVPFLRLRKNVVGFCTMCDEEGMRHIFSPVHFFKLFHACPENKDFLRRSDII